MSWNIDDYGLHPKDLEDKYERKGAHPDYDWVTFRREVSGHGVNDEAYWIWVKSKLQDEQEELDRDKHYN